MAYIKTRDNHYVKVTPEQGNRIWLLLNNELQPRDQAESDKLDRVEQVILNKQNPSTPLSYLVAHPSVDVPDSYAGVLGVRG